MDTVLYYFDTLPLHPGPRPLESFTSYLTRIVEANGTLHQSGLNAFTSDYSQSASFADYPPRSFGMLPMLVTHSEDELLKTTFYHMAKKFGRVCQPRSLVSFFSGLIASSLRFCPFCLQEELFYRLTWRFLSTPGCPKHACRLSEHCSHCGCLIPILACPLRIGFCPTCKRDLRTSVPNKLTNEELQEVLKISERPLSIKAICNVLGILKTGLNKYDRVKTFLGCRLNHNKPTPRMQDPLFEEKLLEQAEQAIHELSQRGKPITHQTVSTYLDISRWEIILYPQVKKYLGQFVDYAQQQQKHAKECELILLEKVRAGVIELKEHNQPVIYNSISKIIGINHATWWPYAELRAFVEQHLDSRYLRTLKEREKREKVLISRLEKVLIQLETAGKPVTFSSIARMLEVRSYILMSYPRVQAFIEQRIDPSSVRGRQARRSEEEVMSDVQSTINLLIERNARVNYISITREMREITARTLKTYPKVRVLVDEYLRLDHHIQLHQFALREEQLLNRVKAAIREIEALGKPVTQRELLDKLGKNRTTLRSYPRVNAFIEQKITRHHVYQQRRKQPDEEELLQRVKEAIADLIECNEHVTLTKVALNVHYSPNVLMQYPRVALEVEQNRYNRQEIRLEREKELLNLIKDAIDTCRQNGYPITKESLSCIVGINRTALYRYQSVRALMSEAANEDKQQRQERRFKKREEELFQQALNAIQQLRDSGLRVSIQSVEKIVHVSFISLRRYPMVKTLLKNTIAAQPPTHKLEHELHIPYKVYSKGCTYANISSG